MNAHGLIILNKNDNFECLMLNYELKRAVILSKEKHKKNHRNLELKEFDFNLHEALQHQKADLLHNR